MNISDIAKLEFDIFGQEHKYGIFRTCVVCIDTSSCFPKNTSKSSLELTEQEILSIDLRMYGAQVVKEFASNVTHMIFSLSSDRDHIAHIKSINRERTVKFYCVRPEWVTDSIKKGSLVDERAYSF